MAPGFWRHFHGRLRQSSKGAAHGRGPLTLCHSGKLVPDVSNRGSSVLIESSAVSLSSCRGGTHAGPAEATREKRTAPWDGAATKTTASPPVVGAASHAAKRRRPPRNGKRHETEGRMRSPPLQRRGRPEGEGQKNAPASGATSWRLRAGLCPSHFFFCHSCESRNPVSFLHKVGRVSRRRNPTPQPPVGLRYANPTYNCIWSELS